MNQPSFRGWPSRSLVTFPSRGQTVWCPCAEWLLGVLWALSHMAEAKNTQAGLERTGNGEIDRCAPQVRDELWLTRIFGASVSVRLISTSKWALLGLQTQWPIASLVLCVPQLAALGPEDCLGSLWSLAGQLIGANHTTSPPFVNDYHTRVIDCFHLIPEAASAVEETQGSGVPLLVLFCFGINSR